MNSDRLFRKVASLLDDVDMGCTDVKKIHQLVVEKLKAYSHYTHIGRVEVHQVKSKNMFHPTGENVFFKSDYAPVNLDESEAVVVEAEEINRTTCTIKFYPEAGYEWNDEEKEMALRISKLVSIIVSRADMLNDLSRIQYIDTMTGLDNSASVRRIGIELQDRKLIDKYVAMWVNLKGFKYTNKKYGPRIGDEMLKYVGLKMLTFIGSLDGNNYVSRFGGDNFFLLVLKDNVDVVLKEITSFEYNREILGREVDIELPIRAGVCVNDGKMTMSDMIANTNFAVDVARAGKEDIVWFNEEMGKKILNAKRMVMEFPKALANGDIMPYYQPKVGTYDGNLCGAEALCRWKLNDEILPPIAFLSAIERDGVVKELDLYMLECVCKDLRDWLDRGIEPVRTSVNYSKVDLGDRHLIEQTRDILRRYNIDSKYIEIEITETVGYEDDVLLESFIDSMRNDGIKISMDDFGTGYSSLYLFKDKCFDVVKIDKSFVDNISDGMGKDKVILTNMIKMLKELDVEITAEGVENEEQISFLKECGCQVIQGYFYDKPLPRDEFEKRLINREYK